MRRSSLFSMVVAVTFALAYGADVLLCSRTLLGIARPEGPAAKRVTIALAAAALAHVALVWHDRLAWSIADAWPRNAAALVIFHIALILIMASAFATAMGDATRLETFLRAGDTFEKARVIFEAVIEPIVFRSKPNQQAGRLAVAGDDGCDCERPTRTCRVGARSLTDGLRKTELEKSQSRRATAKTQSVTTMFALGVW